MDYLKLFINHFTMDSMWFMLKVFLTATVLALVLELIFVETKKATLYKIFTGKITGAMKKDATIWSMELLMIWPFFGKVLTLSIGVYLGNMLNTWTGGVTALRFITEVPFLPLQILLALMAGDFTLYWLHRTFHSFPALWQLHKYHHSATEMTVFSGQRDNPVVGQLFVIFTGLPSTLLGSPPMIPLWVTILNVTHAQIIHSQIKSDWGWFGKWFIISPHAHLVHHSMQPEHRDQNFAFLFPIWDHMFGTFYSGENKNVDEIGIDEVDLNLSPFKQIIVDTLSSAKIIWESKQTMKLKAHCRRTITYISKIRA